VGGRDEVLEDTGEGNKWSQRKRDGARERRVRE